MSAKTDGARVAGVSLLAALVLVVLGFITGQHGFVDFFAFVIGPVGCVTGAAMWSIGWLGERCSKSQR
jgi:hypothetical protein